MDKQLTTQLLEQKGFMVYPMGEFICCLYAFENEDKTIETDLQFWIRKEDTNDIQFRIYKIDKRNKNEHVSKLMLDVPINDIEHANKFLDAFDINNLKL